MNQGHLRKTFLALKLCLVFVLVYVATATVISTRSLRALMKPQQANGDQSLWVGDGSADPAEKARDYSLILKNNVFAPDGPAEKSDIAQLQGSAQQTGIPVARELSLELLGTIAGSQAVSRALIRTTATGQTSLYRIGQRVGNVSIEAIDKESVTLNDRGMRKTLRLNAKGRASGAASRAESPPRIAGRPATIRSTDQAARAALGLSRLGRVEQVLRKARIQPYSVNGQVQGLMVSGLENIPEAKQFGLRDGDIVRQLNGQLLTSKQKAFQVLKKARTQPQINILLSRDGASKELSFDLW